MNNIIPLLEQLIACPSVTPDDAGCQEILCNRLKPLGFQCETMTFDKVTNLWAKRGDQKPLVVFAGHTDVVPTGPVSEWLNQPFKAFKQDGLIYGRGTADMKGALSAMIIAVENFIKQNPKFAASIGFLITSDEEGPGIHGTKKVIDILTQRGEKIDYCIVGEPSSMDKVGDQLRIGRRGSLHGKLRIQGKQGHVAHPQFAKNPIHISLMALQEIVETEWDRGNNEFPATTFQITNIHAGTGAANVIPGSLEVIFNLRYSPASSAESIKQRVEAILKKYKFDYAIEWDLSAEPFLTKKGTLIKAIQKAIAQTTGLDPQLSTGGGTSDARFLAPLGIEVVELGVSNATAHHINEHVSVESLTTLAQIYEATLEQLLIPKRKQK